MAGKGKTESDFILLVYRNYGLLPKDEVFNEAVRIDSEHSEYTVQFDSDVNGKTFALEIRWNPQLDAGDTALLEPPVEIDFNYQIEEVEESPEYKFELPKTVGSPQLPKRKPIPPEEDVEYKFDLPFLRK